MKKFNNNNITDQKNPDGKEKVTAYSLTKDFLYVIIGLVYNLGSWSFVYMKLWNWFIYTKFPVDQISYLTAVGLTFILATVLYLGKLTVTRVKFSEDNVSELLTKAIISPWVILFIGYVLTFFV